MNSHPSKLSWGGGESRWIAAGCLAALMCLPVLCHAGGYEGPGIGARALSLGGAFIGLADDPSAIYWNPAGLMQLEGCGELSEYWRPDVTVTDGDSVFNGNPPGVPLPVFYVPPGRAEPQFTGTRSHATAYHPSTYFWNRNGKSTIAAGVYTPIGGGAKWSDGFLDPASGAAVSAELESLAHATTYNVSLAWQDSREVAVGLGLNYVWGESSLEATKVYAGSTNAALPDYSTRMVRWANGHAIERVAGLLWKPSSQWQVGGVWRSGRPMNLRGGFNYAVLNGAGAPAGPVLASSVTQRLSTPTTFGFGVAHKPNSKLTVCADWNRTNWSVMRLDLNFPAPLPDVLTNPRWEDSDRLRLGVEYRPGNTWTYRLGLLRDEAAVPGTPVLDFAYGLVDINKTFLTLGVSHKWRRGEVQLTYLHGRGGRAANGTTYSYEADSLLVGWQRPL